MGILTTLSSISLTTSELNAGAAKAVDVSGLFTECQIKASELVRALQQINNLLPAGDPNIATIQSAITTLS